MGDAARDSPRRLLFFLEMSGKSEANMRRLFDNAKRHAPSLLFFDEIDCITAKRDGAGKEMERRIVAQFLSCMDELGDVIGTSSNVIVMGATNRPEALDPSLRRAGRFDREINLGVPDEAGIHIVFNAFLIQLQFKWQQLIIFPPARLHILKVVCARLRTEGSFDLQASACSRCLRCRVGFGINTAAFRDGCPCSLQTIAHLTPGFVGADLEAISKEASTIAVKRIINRNDLAGSQVSTQPCSCPVHSFTRVCSFRSFPVYAAPGALPRRLCLMITRCKELTPPHPAMPMPSQLLMIPAWLLAIPRNWRTHRARLQTTRRCRTTCRRSSSSP